MEQLQSSSQFTKDFLEQFAASKEQLVCVDSGASLKEAAQLMLKKHVGSVIVVEEKSGKKTPVGIITDRDLMIETLAQDVDPSSLNVKDIMTRTLATAPHTDDIFSMIAKMKENGVHRLPIVDQKGELTGIVTSRKLVQCLIQGLNDLSALSLNQHQKEKQVRH